MKRYKKIGILLLVLVLGCIFLWWKLSYQTKQQFVELEKEKQNASTIELEHTSGELEGESVNGIPNKTIDRELIVGTERAVETQAVLLQNNLVDGDLVDVRIRYPNGEEYVVLAKRGCHELEKIEGRVTFFLTEEEILCLSSSIVDCVQYDASLYTVRYLRDKKQISATVNYIPREDVCQLMVDNPNIIGESELYLQKKYRKPLENRLKDWSSRVKKIIKLEQDSINNREEGKNKKLGGEESRKND